MRSSPKLPTMPLYSSLSNSLQSWLGHELEMRGIDSMIYTRYILSILQQDSAETDFSESNFFPPSKKASMLGLNPGSTSPFAAVKNSGASKDAALGKMVMGARGNRAGKKLDRKKSIASGADLSSDERKKCAAVECLLSVSDDDSGIEGLVDELCMKLKEQSNYAMPDTVSQHRCLDPESSDSVISVSPDDIAERYYAAFPALSDAGEEALNPVVAPTADMSWSTVAQRGSPLDTDTEANEQLIKAIVTGVLEDSDNQDDVQTPVYPGIYELQDELEERSLMHSSPSGNPIWPKSNMYFRPIHMKSQDSRRYGYPPMFRGWSHERDSQQRISPRLNKKNSCPDFMHVRDPGFIYPMLTREFMADSRPYGAPQVVQGSAEHSTGKITLQEIFGTEKVSKIEPCKTLVVDGQLVRLCATSVNGDNLDRIPNLALTEAPMEELVAQNLWQEAEKEQAGLPQDCTNDPSTAVECVVDSSVNDSGCEHSPQKASAGQQGAVSSIAVGGTASGNDEPQEEDTDVEDPVWYCAPVDQLSLASPVMSGSRLYKRQSNSEPRSTVITPTSNVLWEEVWDDSGVYIGAKLSKDSVTGEHEMSLDEDQIHYSLVKDIIELTDSESEADYIDMTACSGVSMQDCQSTSGLTGNFQGLYDSKRIIDGGKSPDRLEIFKALAAEDELETVCTCDDDLASSKQFGVNSSFIQEPDVSQYKGCVTPEITQNKVPDDRPVFFLEDSERRNNHSTSAKVSEHFIHANDHCTYDNLLHSSFIPTSTSAPTSSSVPFSSMSLLRSSDTFPLDPVSSYLTSTSHSTMQAMSSLWKRSSEDLSSDALSIWNEPSKFCMENLHFPWSSDLQAVFTPGSPYNYSTHHNYRTPWAAWTGDQKSNLLDLQVHGLSVTFPLSGLSLGTDSIWTDPPMVPPPKIWDINLSSKITMESPIEAIGSSLSKYIFQLQQFDKSSFFQSNNEQSCLEDGWYGQVQTTEVDDVWSLPSSESSEDEGICDQDEPFYNLPFSPIYKQANGPDVARDQPTVWCMQRHEQTLMATSMSKITGSMDLLPSETSAFSNEVPSRLSSIPHVQSEPSMSCRQPQYKWSQNKYRMVQVKHLYKPDSSILRHLGLASAAYEDEPLGNKTPEHHFKPIAASVVATAPEQDVSKSKNVAASSYVILDGVSGAKKADGITLTDTQEVEDNRSESGSPRSASGSLYQRYRGQETVDVSFIPRFKIRKEHKYIQTGEQSPWNQWDEDLEQEITERLVNEVLSADDEFDDPCDGNPGCDQDWTGHMTHSQGSQTPDCQHSARQDDQLSPADLARLWGEDCLKEDLESSNSAYEADVNTSHDASGSSSIWCYGTDTLPEVVSKDSSWEFPLSNTTMNKSFDLDSHSPSVEMSRTLTQNFLEELLGRSKGQSGISRASTTSVSDVYRYEIDNYCNELLKDLEVLQMDYPIDHITKAVGLSKTKLSSSEAGIRWRGHGSSPINIPDFDCLINAGASRKSNKDRRPSEDLSEEDPQWPGEDAHDDRNNMMFHMDASDVPNYSCDLSHFTGDQWSHMNESQSYAVKNHLESRTIVNQGTGSSFKERCTLSVDGSLSHPDSRTSPDLSKVTYQCWEDGDNFRLDGCPFHHGHRP